MTAAPARLQALKDASIGGLARLASASLKLIPYKAIAHFRSAKE
jgi:hypothetical protein